MACYRRLRHPQCSVSASWCLFLQQKHLIVSVSQPIVVPFVAIAQGWESDTSVDLAVVEKTRDPVHYLEAGGLEYGEGVIVEEARSVCYQLPLMVIHTMYEQHDCSP